MEPILNKCRCCLQDGEHTHNIQRDLYMEMFRETLNLLPISDLRLPRWICSTCVDSLEAAKRFRDMVMAAERQLLHALNPYFDSVATPPVDNVWIKEEARDTDGRDYEDVATLQCSDDTRSYPNADIKMPVPDTQLHNEDVEEMMFVTKRETQELFSPQLGKRSDSGSDTFSYDLKVEKIEVEFTKMGENENAVENVFYSEANMKYLQNATTVTQFATKQDEYAPPTPNDLIIVPDVKSLLHNFTKQHPVKNLTNETSPNTKRRLTTATKLRENIILIMQNSTIVPFRHNSNFINDYICYYCENTYKSMNELREHTDSQHVGKVSDDNIMSFMRSRAHKLIYADISFIKCRLCNETVNTLDTLTEHLVKIHKKVYHATDKNCDGILGFELGSDELKCHLCNNHFECFRSLYSHMNEHYEAYICYSCQKKFVNLIQYRTHLKTHVVTEEKEFNCDHCGMNCKTKTGLVYHMKRHHLNVTLKCEHCPETFRFKEYRKREEHMIEVHGMKKEEQKYMCDICQNGKVYSSKNTLKIHKSNVHKVGDVLRIQCELCNFVTHHTKRMKEHMDIHNGVKNYGCDLCGKRFTKPYTLRVHMRMHLNDKRYGCPLCEEAFVHKNVLQSHMKKKHPDSDIAV